MMGKVLVKEVLLKNHRDEILFEEGHISSEQVRQITLDMVADTGAVAVSLPQSVVEKLGLRYMKDVLVTVSTGERKPVKMYGDLMVYIEGREAYTQCLAKPEEAPFILGQLVFEQIDYIVDCKNQRICPNPEEQQGVMLFDDFSSLQPK